MKKIFLTAVVLLASFNFTIAQTSSTSVTAKTVKVMPTPQPIGKPSHISQPAKEDVIYGNSEFKRWDFDALQEGVTFGIWESTPGKWKYKSNDWEYCRILSGKAIITEDNGKSILVQAGDSFLLKAGVSCTWEVLETIRKDFVSYRFNPQ